MQAHGQIDRCDLTLITEPYICKHNFGYSGAKRIDAPIPASAARGASAVT